MAASLLPVPAGSDKIRSFEYTYNKGKLPGSKRKVACAALAGKKTAAGQLPPLLFCRGLVQAAGEAVGSAAGVSVSGAAVSVSAAGLSEAWASASACFCSCHSFTMFIMKSQKVLGSSLS